MEEVTRRKKPTYGPEGIPILEIHERKRRNRGKVQWSSVWVHKRICWEGKTFPSVSKPLSVQLRDLSFGAFQPPTPNAQECDPTVQGDLVGGVPSHSPILLSDRDLHHIRAAITKATPLRQREVQLEFRRPRGLGCRQGGPCRWGTWVKTVRSSVCTRWCCAKVLWPADDLLRNPQARHRQRSDGKAGEDSRPVPEYDDRLGRGDALIARAGSSRC